MARQARSFFVLFAFLLVAVNNGENQCTMYGECNTDDFGRIMNCKYDGPPRSLHNVSAVNLMRQFCPEYIDDSHGAIDVCCDADQLFTLNNQFGSLKSLFNRCPSCLANFRRLFCALTCDPNQADFIVATATGVNNNKIYVKSLEYNLARTFAYGLFNSCKDVQYQSQSKMFSSISGMCGTSPDHCNATVLFASLGSSYCSFELADEAPTHSKFNPNIIVNAMNKSIARCNQNGPGFSACTCQDCPIACFKLKPSIPLPRTMSCSSDSQEHQEKNYFDCHFGPSHRTEQIIIRRKNHRMVSHDLGGDFPGNFYLSNLFDKDFLKEMIILLQQIQNLTIVSDKLDQTFTLSDICFKPDNYNCAVQSVTNYFQNNASNLDLVIWDKSGFFLVSDIYNHLLDCLEGPLNVLTPLGISCLGDFGGPLFPSLLLGGFSGNAYRNATSMVITFVLDPASDNSPQMLKVTDWEAAFKKFMQKFIENNTDIYIVSYQTEGRQSTATNCYPVKTDLKPETTLLVQETRDHIVNMEPTL